jgi:hypothetical protein
LDAFKLDPPLKGTGVRGAGGDPNVGPRHIFDFGSSGTWGGGKQGHGHDDWDIPVVGIGSSSACGGGGGSNGGLFGTSDTYGLTDSTDPTAFINIPSSWGAAATTTGNKGFGGISMHGNNNKTND